MIVSAFLVYQKIKALYFGTYSGAASEQIQLGAKQYGSFLAMAQNAKIVLVFTCCDWLYTCCI